MRIAPGGKSACASTAGTTVIAQHAARAMIDKLNSLMVILRWLKSHLSVAMNGIWAVMER
jgi:hypothetical protein